MYGLGPDWHGPRWLERIDGTFGVAPFAITLAHGDRPYFQEGQPLVLVTSTLRKPPVPMAPRTDAVLALLGLTAVANVLRPELDDQVARRLTARLVPHLEHAATHWDSWPRVEWLIHGETVMARFASFDVGWAGFCNASDDVAVVVAAYGVPPVGLSISSVRSDSEYHFALTRPIEFPEAIRASRMAALGPHAFGSGTGRRLDGTFRRLLEDA